MRASLLIEFDTVKSAVNINGGVVIGAIKCEIK